MKISKKNWAAAVALAGLYGNNADPDEIAHELQKRDDKIKALRTKVKALQIVRELVISASVGEIE